MRIWKQTADLQQIKRWCSNTLSEHLAIEVTEIGEDYLRGTMPVDARTHQPMGILHGGASVALAESLGSIAAHLAAEPGVRCVGLDINANHVRSVSEGLVTGTARPLHGMARAGQSHLGGRMRYLAGQHLLHGRDAG